MSGPPEPDRHRHGLAGGPGANGLRGQDQRALAAVPGGRQGGGHGGGPHAARGGAGQPGHPGQRGGHLDREHQEERRGCRHRGRDLPLPRHWPPGLPLPHPRLGGQRGQGSTKKYAKSTFFSVAVNGGEYIIYFIV